jgi:hypothetical protein
MKFAVINLLDADGELKESFVEPLSMDYIGLVIDDAFSDGLEHGEQIVITAVEGDEEDYLEARVREGY